MLSRTAYLSVGIIIDGTTISTGDKRIYAM